MSAMKIKKGDTVQVITGTDKGKEEMCIRDSPCSSWFNRWNDSYERCRRRGQSR